MHINVLIVDDSQIVRDLIRELLVREPGLVICGEAQNGLEAIQKAETLRPDLVILDLAMPRLNGAQAAAVLRRILPDVQIVLFTMFAETAERLAPAVEANMVLSKPEGLRKLVEGVRALASSRSVQRREVAD